MYFWYYLQFYHEKIFKQKFPKKNYFSTINMCFWAKKTLIHCSPIIVVQIHVNVFSLNFTQRLTVTQTESNQELTKECLISKLRSTQKLYHTVYPVTPNAGMFYQRGCKRLRRGNTQGKKTCNLRISIVSFSNISFQTFCKRAFF